MRAEALACYAAANIDCMGREEAKRRREGVMSNIMVAGHHRTSGSSWQSLQRGTGDIETSYLNGEIVLLGRLYEIATPVNEACLEMAGIIISKKYGPGAFSVKWLEERIAGLKRL
jgi:2-dehydropantoate 2-reductase